MPGKPMARTVVLSLPMAEIMVLKSLLCFFFVILHVFLLRFCNTVVIKLYAEWKKQTFLYISKHFHKLITF